MEQIVKTDEIGRKIKFFRQNARLSQEKLAEYIGVTPQQVQKYETAKTKISTERIQLIAHILQVHPAAFFHDRPDELTLNKPEADFIRKLREIRDPDIQTSLMMILTRLAKG